jgi:hypothetical protein
VVEVLMATILLALIIGAVVSSFVGGGKSSKAVMNNLILNESAQRIVDMVTNDIRESNLLAATMPAFISTAALGSLKTDGTGFPTDAKNGLHITQMEVKVNPTAVGASNQTLKRIVYSLEKEHPNDSSPWILYRSEAELDPTTKQEIPATIRKKFLAENLEECLFYRLGAGADEEIAGARNVHFRFRLREREKDTAAATRQKFTNEVISVANMRGGDL